MAKEKIRYEEISKANISDARNLVISRCSKGGFTLAQQILAKDGKHEVGVFMKGAIHIKDIDAMERVKDAINVVIQQAKERADEDDSWDEDEL